MELAVFGSKKTNFQNKRDVIKAGAREETFNKTDTEFLEGNFG